MGTRRSTTAMHLRLGRDCGCSHGLEHGERGMTSVLIFIAGAAPLIYCAERLIVYLSVP
jgi:hypothetical protein